MRKKKRRKINLVFIIPIIISVFIIYKSSLFINIRDLSASIIIPKIKNKKIMENEYIKELKKEIEILKEDNKIKNVLTDSKVINAYVIKRSAPYWNDTITINKGKLENIKRGSAVINNNGLVGEVTKVYKHSSDVKLIVSSSNNYISAKFNNKNKDYYGIIKKYNIITKELYMENVIGDLNKDIINKKIITSGLSSNMPSGLLIGTITDIKKDKYNLSNTIVLKLDTDINDLNMVKVVQKND